MKKIIVFLLLSLLLFSLLGCSKEEDASKFPKKEKIKESPKLPKDFKGIHQLELEEHKNMDEDSSK